MLLLLTFLLIPYASVQQIPRACLLQQQLRRKMQDEHNKLRQQVTQAKLDKKQYGDLQGTNSMFAVTYDCTNDALANALITSDCKRSDVNVALMGRSANFHETRVRLDESNVQQLEDEFQFAFEEWRDSVSKPLNKDVVYNDVSIAPFANMIYYKTASLGCAYTYCKDKKKIAIACVYGDEPKQRQPLYLPVESAKGCTKKACEAVVPGAKCEKNPGNEQKLCVIGSTTETESTSTSASTTTETITTTASEPSTETMTQELRDKVLTMHNYRRSILAKGQVRNGKEGNPNCPTATNMYKMRYDMDLEAEADKYASTCPMLPSEKSDRFTGENFKFFGGNTTIPYMDAITKAQQSWWSQIYKNGVNAQMKYNAYLEEKPDAPTSFTQMGWAATYMVGCAVRRCNDPVVGTVVVCRYSPRGNIYTQYIYNKGSVCGSCSSTCDDGLCPPPPN